MDAYEALSAAIQATEGKDFSSVDPVEDCWDRYECLKQDWMLLLDEYSEVAKALGFKGNGFFDDVIEPHEVIVARANELREKANEQ